MVKGSKEIQAGMAWVGNREVSEVWLVVLGVFSRTVFIHQSRLCISNSPHTEYIHVCLLPLQHFAYATPLECISVYTHSCSLFCAKAH